MRMAPPGSTMPAGGTPRPKTRPRATPKPKAPASMMPGSKPKILSRPLSGVTPRPETVNFPRPKTQRAASKAAGMGMMMSKGGMSKKGYAKGGMTNKKGK